MRRAPRPRVDPAFADSVMRKAGVNPVVPYPGSGTRWECVCQRCGETGFPTYDAVRKGMSSGCRPCAIRVTAAKIRAKGEAEAREIAGDNHLEPQGPFPGLCSAWCCICSKCNTVRVIQFYRFKRRPVGCPRCRELSAIAEMVDAQLQPLGVFERVDAPWKCRCTTCGREVSPRLSEVRKSEIACVYCAGRKVHQDDALKVMRAASFEPRSSFPGSHLAWRCLCTKCGQESYPSYHSVQGGQGCGPCAREKSRQLRNDAELTADTMRQAGFEPLELYPGSGEFWRCRCTTCGGVSTPLYNNVKAGRSKCKYCAERGFRPGNPAMVYLIEHVRHGAVKVGIAGTDTRRIATHGIGWRSLAVVHMRGDLAGTVEKGILTWWRKELGLPPYLSKNEMPQGGWTETVDADAIDIPATIERIKTLAAEGKPLTST